jgi:peroxiredoxin Q/BCP
MNKIHTGDLVPCFTLKDQNGNDFDISTFLGRKKLVIFFYPQD